MARKRRYRKKHRILNLLIYTALAILLLYPFYEARNLTVDQKTLVIPGLPPELRNLRIVYLSDIHAGIMYSEGRVWNLIRKINALNPDIILFGGDYADDSAGAIRFFQNMPSLSARILSAGVLGNHDRTPPELNLDLLSDAMIGKQVIPLVNKTYTVSIGGVKLTIAGVDDYYNGRPNVEEVARKTGEDEFVIFLSHSPAALPAANAAVNRNGRERWYNLALCGHTHGGQITFFGKPLFDEFQKVERRYLSGWKEENRVPVLISNGVGTSYVPIRLFAPPQIHLITLRN